jgi:molybdenum cofactor cytidylyltransferase
MMNSKHPTAGIILAAGMSNRFGSPKLLIKIKGRTLIERIVDTSLESKLEHVVLVLGYAYADTIQALAHRRDNPRLQIVENADYRNGMSRSLHLGLKSVQHNYPSVMFLLADQPRLGSEMIDLLLEKFWNSDKDICVPVCEGRKGNPTLFSSRFYKQILNITGDKGAREIIRNNPDNICLVTIDDPLLFFDIDTPADLDKFHDHL